MTSSNHDADSRNATNGFVALIAVKNNKESCRIQEPGWKDGSSFIDSGLAAPLTRSWLKKGGRRCGRRKSQTVFQSRSDLPLCHARIVESCHKFNRIVFASRVEVGFDRLVEG